LKKTLFVTGIDTNIGKTVVSAVLVSALNADYWKPIQSGDLDNSDSNKVAKMVGTNSVIHPETFQLKNPLSPHVSAEMDGIQIDLEDFTIPNTKNSLIIEGAGGLLVPINKKGDYISDLICDLGVEVVLVVKNYLGSINHTLLSIEHLKSRGIRIKGIVVVGDKNEASESIITNNTGVKILHHLPIAEVLDQNFIKQQSELIKKALM